MKTQEYYNEEISNKERFVHYSNRLAELESLLMITDHPHWSALATERANLIDKLADLQELSMQLVYKKSTAELYRSVAMEVKCVLPYTSTPYN